MNLDTPEFDYQALYTDIIREMQEHYGLSRLDAISYAWSIASRGVQAANDGYKKTEH